MTTLSAGTAPEPALYMKTSREQRSVLSVAPNEQSIGWFYVVARPEVVVVTPYGRLKYNIDFPALG